MTLDWGNVPGYLSLGVSLLALATALRGNRRQLRADLQDQARQIVVAPHAAEDAGPGRVKFTLTVENLSSYPVTEVWLASMSRLMADGAHVIDHVARLEPGRAFRVEQVVDAAVDPFPLPLADRYRANASFVDTNGYSWQRWATGEIKAPIDMQAATSGRRLLWRVLPKSIVNRWITRRNRPPVRHRLPD